MSPRADALAKQRAAHAPVAPRGGTALPPPSPLSLAPRTPAPWTATPALDRSFPGTAFTGFYPPDQALAASPQWVLQSVNAAIAIYRADGTQTPAYAIPDRSFFGIPNPSPAGCAGAPDLFDPRAFYDETTGKFWALIDEREGLPGVNPSCAFISRFWIAVSQTSNPTGRWNVYWFDMSFGSGNWADFPGFGVNAQAVFLSANVYAPTAPIEQAPFLYAEVVEANKAAMEAGSLDFSDYAFTDLTAAGVPAFTVQPVVPGPDPSSEPVAGLFVDSLCTSNPCDQLVLWAFNDPIGHDSGGPAPVLMGTVIMSPSFTMPPAGDEPGCAGCIDTTDWRISGAPVYAGGSIWAGLTTSIDNGSQVVPGVLWLRIAASVDGTGTPFGSVAQSGYFDYTGDEMAAYPAFAVDDGGDVIMSFATSSASIYPSIAYAVLPAGETSFPDGGRYLATGGATYRFGPTSPWVGYRWGDYSAAAYDGPGESHLWVAGEYANASGTWSTAIGELSPTPLPQVSLTTSLAPVQASTSIPLTWTNVSGSAAFAVSYRRGSWDAPLGPWSTWAPDTTATGGSFPGRAGASYCFQVEGLDAGGSPGLPSAQTCTIVPLDDRALSASVGWYQKSGPGWYSGTFSKSTAYGATLTRRGVRTSTVVLLVGRGPTYGTIGVYWNGTLLRKLSLRAPGFSRASLVPVATFPGPRWGTVTIRVLSSGRPVLIDGLAVGTR